MDISNWIPALSSTTLLALALWLFRSLISTRLTKSVENEFNTKLENLRSELREKEARIDALQNGAMSGLMSRQSKLYERQLGAIEQIWEAINELSKGKYISSAIASLNFEAAAKEAATSLKFRDSIKQLKGSFDIKSINIDSASKARPFLSELAWSYFNAFRAIILLDAMKLQMLEIGIESPEKYFKSDHVTSLIKAIFPHQSNNLDKYGSSVHYHFLEDIESLLLIELQNMQKGNDSDKENAERAASILKESKKLMESILEEEIA